MGCRDLVDGKVDNQISVDPETIEWSKVALERMLAEGAFGPPAPDRWEWRPQRKDGQRRDDRRPNGKGRDGRPSEPPKAPAPRRKWIS